MEFSSNDISSLGCKKKCNDKCQCSSVAQVFGNLWKNINNGNNNNNKLMDSWGCMYNSCCAISSLYSAESFGFKIEELVKCTNVEPIYQALESIEGIEQVTIDPSSLEVKIKGSGVLSKSLSLLIGMGYHINKIILDKEPKPTRTSKMIEMPKIPRGKGKKKSNEEDQEPLLSSITVENDSIADIKLYFKVGGMTCASCSGMIQNMVASVKDVHSCDVNLLSEEMVVRCPADVDRSVIAQSIISAVEDIGFTAEEIIKNTSSENSIITTSLNIQGMTCASCSGIIESGLTNTKGVVSVSVNLLSNFAIVTYDATITGPRSLIESVTDLGFGASLRSDKDQDSLRDSLTRKREIESLKKKFSVSLAFTLPIILITMVFMYIPGLKHILHSNVAGVPRLPWESVLAGILATPVQFYCGWEFYIKAWKSLKAKAANMEVLVATGSSVAYTYSLFSVIKRALDPAFGGQHFFETSAALILFVLLGRLLENIAKGQTSLALVHLMDLKPKSALLVKEYNTSSQQEEEILADLIQTGDVLKVLPGSSIPADGVVVAGLSSVNESMITGESQSVTKEVESQVIGGTINNEGLLYIKAARVGANSTLSQIVQLVEQAQTSKPPIQAFADKITGYFVPVAVCLAVITFLIWLSLGFADAYPSSWRNGTDKFLFALMFGISALVISCPCALGLATPTAVMVGTGVGAKLGLLIKGGKPLELAHKVNVILFDKTGTLTAGKPQVTDCILADNNGGVVPLGFPCSPQHKHFLHCLGTAESASEHPLGQAIVKFCKESSDTPLSSPTNFSVKAGRGLICQVDQSKVLIGNRAFLSENNDMVAPIPIPLLTLAGDLETQGKTCVFVAIDGVAVGIVALSDVLKPESINVVKFLRKQGYEIRMVTGDNHRVAEHVGRQLGLATEHIISEVIPSEKGNQVKTLQSQGKIVAFVGDGINDSVALSQADLGIALGSGTDVAMECAMIVVMGSNLQGITTALDLARVTFRRIQYNMLWALLYNTLAIPIAAGVFFPLTHEALPPMLAGFTMAISSVSVVVSSLMLRLYKPKVFANM